MKFQDYQDLKKVALLMENKAHLTNEGLEKICLIKAGMNRGRVEFSQSDLGASYTTEGICASN